MTIGYAAKGRPSGESAFTFPWDEWLKTQEGLKFAEVNRVEGQFMRRISPKQNVPLRNKAAKDGIRYAKMVCTFYS